MHTAADLQAALSNSRLGDEIVLDAGTTYEGNFILGVPEGSGDGWVTVISTGVASLPPPGTRVALADAAYMPTIMSPDYGHSGDPAAPAIGNNYNSTTLSDMGVHHYRFIGINFATGLTAYNYHVLWLSPLNTSSHSSSSSMPHDIIIDRCLIHGNDPLATTFPNGTALLNGSAIFDVANGAIVDSQIYNLWGIGIETQALTCHGGPGPRLIQNNTISGGTEAFMCGGNMLPYANAITTDMTVVHNYFTHPPAWQTSTPVIPYVKNLFELKVGQRVRLTDNVFQGSWDRGGGQHGTALTLIPRNYQDSGYGAVAAILSTDVVDDILVSNNVATSVGRFVTTQGVDDLCYSAIPSVTCVASARELISDNVAVYDTAYTNAPGGGIDVGGMQDFAVKRNTLLGTNGGGGAALTAIYGNRGACSDTFGTNFEWSFNINLNGVMGDCAYDPANILVASWLGNVSVTSNLVANVSGSNLAAWEAFGYNSSIAPTLSSIGLPLNDLSVGTSSPYFGLGIGANLSCFNEAAIVAGTPSTLCPLPAEVQPDGKSYQVIGFAGIGAVTLPSASFELSASASSGLPVSFASTTPSICSLAGSSLIPLAAGTCSITATQLGNSKYSAAAPVVQKFAISQSSQVIHFAGIAAVTLPSPPFRLNASASSGLPVSFASITPGICSAVGSRLTPLAAGACSITATQMGNASYSPAAPAVQTFVISKGAQTIGFAPIAAVTLPSAPFPLNASASSGLPVSFATTTPAICSVTGSRVTPLAAGGCSITATQVGNASYLPAAPVVQSFTISQPPAH